MRLLSASLIAFGLTFAAGTAGAVEPDFLMDAELDLSLPQPIEWHSTSHPPLWIEALSRPDVDLQRMASATVALAHQRGVPNLSAAAPALQAIVATDSSHPQARLAAARALIAIEAREAADVLYEASQQYEIDLRQLVEPALAHWRYAPIQAVWRARLQAGDVRHRDLLLAIRGAEVSEDHAAADLLLSIVHDPCRPALVRLAASRAIGGIRRSGLELECERLQPQPSAPRFNRLCAVALLAHHSSVEAQEILLRLAVDPEPSVAAAALARLNAVDVDRVVPLAEQALRNDDANVRREGVLAWGQRPTPGRVTILAGLLDDPHPSIRADVRDRLFDLSQTAELEEPIRQAAVGVLAKDGWRGQEQAALLLGALDHEPAADRLVELLECPRMEVTVACAWALRKIAVPETLPGILDKATRQTDQRRKRWDGPLLDFQVAHLCEALGLMNYAPAEELLRRYIPKDYSMGELSRGAAIWALGRLHAGVPDEPLAELLAARVTDPAPPPSEPSEMMRVRVMGTVTIVRMRAVSQLPRLRKYMGPKVYGFHSHLAIRWAVEQLTGEILPAPEPEIVSRGEWFLESLDGAKPSLP